MRLISTAATCTVLLLATVSVQHITALEQTFETSEVPPVVTQGATVGSCPSQLQRQSALQTINEAVSNALGLQIHGCGPGAWTRIAYLNMNDSTQTCPSAWTDRSSNGVRACGRPGTGCYSNFYSSSGRTYTRVCGRVIGFQIGHTDGFRSFQSIDSPYVEGVSITHGFPRSHIWTFAADLYESIGGCPCEPGGGSTPFFVGNNYYCESGNNGTSQTNDFLHANDPLWDGQQCQSEGTCCSTAPWFSMNLFRPTSDSIEVRICADSTPTEDTPINLLEIYIL